MLHALKRPMNYKENNKEVLPITKNAIKVRDWERSNLPIEQSALALDLFLVIAYNTLKGKPLTLKLLFHTIDFSEAGIRKHLKRLLADGWCSRVRHQIPFFRLFASRI